MNPECSITLTPSHECVPVLMDFIIDHAKPPYPARKELADIVTELGQAKIKRLNIYSNAGIWRVEFSIGGRGDVMKITGRSEEFDKALYNALSEIRKLPAPAAVSA